MAPRRPEGLGPCYYSLCSPDIPDSHIFRWQYRKENSSDYQTKVQIKIWDASYNLLKTYTKTTQEFEIPVEEVGYSFKMNTVYHWSIIAYNKSGVASDESVRARFLYMTAKPGTAVNWTYIPKPNEVITNKTYFEELKMNLTIVLDDYRDVPKNVYTNVTKLFTREVVPDREDFASLEVIMNYISQQMENSSQLYVQDKVEDSLGITDMEYIRERIDFLLTVRPEPVDKLSFDIGFAPSYEVYNMRVDHDGRRDTTIDVSWKVRPLEEMKGAFIFDEVSDSKDVWYYKVNFSYGPSNAAWTSILYFRPENMYDESARRFATDWSNLYTVNTLGLAQHQLQVITVDRRGNESTAKTHTKTWGKNFQVRLGVKHYEVAYQKRKLTQTSPDKNGSWSKPVTTTKQKYTHKVTGGEGNMFYRIRAIDITGMKSHWQYTNGVPFDPLDPPAPPKNFKCTWSNTSSMTLSWGAGDRAEYYEFRAETNRANMYSGKRLSYTPTGLNHNTGYDWFVRSVNAAGTSKWVSCVGRTKSKRATKEQKATRGKSWRDNWGWRTDNDYVYQGEWCEIEGSPHQTAPAGTCWGKHKGMWIFDDKYWRDTLKGKKIIKVEMWLQRKSWYHGYYNDQTPTFWLHNYTNFPKGQPSFSSKFKPGKDFDLGEKAWVTLPNYYGEYIRDNKAKGIGIYVDKWARLPYIQYYSNAKLRITYE